MKRKVLLGVNNYNELVFGEFSLDHPKYWNKKNGNYTDKNVIKFSASFETVKPFMEDEYDLEDYYKDWQEGLDKGYLYDLCMKFDCKPSELAGKLAEKCYDIRDAIDCSLYPECYEINGKEWYFESVNCGQYDSRKDGMKIYTSQKIYDKLHELWDAYHLKEIDKGVAAQVENLVKMCEDIQEHEEEWIKNYIYYNVAA